MPRVPSPIPIFPSYDNFPADIESFPPNVHVRARLKQLDLSLRPFEACEYAWRFIQSKLLAGEILYALRYSLYTRCIETLLNWCFLIRKKSVFYLNHEDVREFIRFFVSPESSWVGVSPFNRLIVARSVPYTDWKINPGWRIFVRKKDEPPVKRIVREMCVTMKEFLAFIFKGEGEGFASLQRAISEASKPTSDLILFANKEIYVTKESYVLSAAEIEWLLDMVRCRSLGFLGQDHLYNKYQRITFVVAVACYTKIPLGSISRQLNKAGLLIQFERLSSGSWVFHESLGSNSQGEINLEPGFIPYLEQYLFHYAACPPFHRSHCAALMPENLKKTAGLIYSIRYVVPAVALTIYVIAGLAYFIAFKYWPSLPANTQSAILENLSLAVNVTF